LLECRKCLGTGTAQEAETDQGLLGGGNSIVGFESSLRLIQTSIFRAIHPPVISLEFANGKNILEVGDNPHK
jgi:hypothetical protein